jgi:hypothetical protein
MKKQLLAFAFIIVGLSLLAQTPRLCLYEEFTGETCPPCATTNPGLNAILLSPLNKPLIAALKWQVRIPSAPTATWSLYQTNKVEIDWRAQNYGYGINSAPSGRIDGQSQTVFGAGSDHPVTISNQVIATAQSFTSAFSVTLNRTWNTTFDTVKVVVNITATAPFTPVGLLKFRLVMTEETIQFATPPGTNGETLFEDVAIKSFPTIQNGTALTAGSWTVNQTQTFTINCALPSYVRDKSEVAFVGFIQDDGNRKVAQAVRAGKVAFPNDAKAVSASVGSFFTCGVTAVPQLVVKNNGTNAITNLTISSTVDGNTVAPTIWTGNIATGATSSVALNALNQSGGGHNVTFNITGVNGTDFNPLNNKASTSFYFAGNYSGTPVAEDFLSTSFPPAQWGLFNSDGGASWTRFNSAGGFGLSTSSAKYDFYSNGAQGDADDLILPPMNLSGAVTPTLTFDMAYRQYSAAYSDKLEVFISDDCGLTWTSEFSKNGSTLSTVAGYQTSAFVPSQLDTTQWRTESIALPGYNYATLLVKFTATSAYGNNLYIDNINLRQQNPTGIASVKNTNLGSVGLFPNPSNAETTLKINAVSAANANISIVNILGQTVYNQTANLSAGHNSIRLDVSDFAAGVYNVVIESNNTSTVKKLNITK